MFSPQLYSVLKLRHKTLIDCQYNLQLTHVKLREYYVQEQDNSLFRQIRLLTGHNGKHNPYIVFVDCKGSKSQQEELSYIVLNGFAVNGTRYVISERSASMTRAGILGFVAESIEQKLVERITMGLQIDKTVLSKYYAYRGLMFSACHCLEGYVPKIVIVPDCYLTISDQRIKYAYDSEIEFVDKDGNNRIWVQKDITEKNQDITINAFDGCGIHHPLVSRDLQQRLNSQTRITSVIWRAPFIKGVTHELDYKRYFANQGVKNIHDIWGVAHSVEEPMIIMTESMYKGKPYFEQYKDERDWRRYWNLFEKYDHCIGVAKWNFSSDEEPVYTRSNYQILQDLKLPYEEFAQLAGYSVDMVQKIVDGDMLHTYCYLGLTADRHKPLNGYCQAILKNPEMLKEHGVRQYLIRLLQKTINDMKCGKLYIRSCFKFFTPDLLMFLEHIAGMPVTGCLNADEFYSFSAEGACRDEHLITRNPHICKSEHVILNGTTNAFLDEYCSHLSNTCIVNGKSIVAQRLNGADYDGDLVLVIDNALMRSGVDRSVAVVIDTEDKATAIAKEDTQDNRLALVLRTMNSLIGETSNCATGFHNKVPKTQEQREKYERYIDLLSIINGKAIDYAKTGILYNIPRHIAKYSKPLPYFMKYASEYYGQQHKFNHAYSNMNRLCKELERWHKTIRFKRSFKDFDYRIMIDESIPFNQQRLDEIENIYLEFCSEMIQLSKDQYGIRQEMPGFSINWEYYYDTFRKRCAEVCPNQKELANHAVRLCYELHPNKNKKFMWRVAESGVVANIQQVPVNLPQRDPDGQYEYLGKRYSFNTIKNVESPTINPSNINKTKYK